MASSRGRDQALTAAETEAIDDMLTLGARQAAEVLVTVDLDDLPDGARVMYAHTLATIELASSMSLLLDRLRALTRETSLMNRRLEAQDTHVQAVTDALDEVTTWTRQSSDQIGRAAQSLQKLASTAEPEPEPAPQERRRRRW